MLNEKPNYFTREATTPTTLTENEYKWRLLEDEWSLQ